jgi:uncharacterized membrane protein
VSLAMRIIETLILVAVVSFAAVAFVNALVEVMAR